MNLYNQILNFIIRIFNLNYNERKNLSWQSMRDLGSRLGLIHKSSKGNFFGKLNGEVNEHEVCIDAAAEYIECRVTVYYKHKLKGIYLHFDPNMKVNKPVGVIPFKTSSREFNSLFSCRYATQQVAECLKNHSDLLNDFILFWNHWLKSRACIEITEKYISCYSGGYFNYIPFYNVIPGERKIINEPQELITAQERFLLELIELSESFETALQLFKTDISQKNESSLSDIMRNRQNYENDSS